MILRTAIALAIILAGAMGSYAGSGTVPARDARFEDPYVGEAQFAELPARASRPSALILAAAQGAAAPPQTPSASSQGRRAADAPGDFEFFLLSLSWSPSYCAAQGAARDARQCRSARPFAFIVHGLWPQKSGSYPDFCQTPPPFVPEETITAMGDIMPSKGLILHEWRKHGTCTGLSPEAYFALVRAAFAKVAIPEAFAAPRAPLSMTAQAVEEAFRAANPALGGDMIAVDCQSDRLREVRICLSKDLAFTPCPQVDRRGCALRRVLEIPAPQ